MVTQMKDYIFLSSFKASGSYLPSRIYREVSLGLTDVTWEMWGMLLFTPSFF